jgi:hypothetical protein
MKRYTESFLIKTFYILAAFYFFTYIKILVFIDNIKNTNKIDIIVYILIIILAIYFSNNNSDLLMSGILPFKGSVNTLLFKTRHLFKDRNAVDSGL